MERGKQGQFYIIAAIFIILILIGLMTTNYLRTRSEKTKIYDLGDELKFESGKVIDYGIYQNEIIPNILGTWTTDFYSYSQEFLTQDEDLVFVYGNFSGMWVKTFREITSGNINVNIGENTGIPITTTGQHIEEIPGEPFTEEQPIQVDIVIDGKPYKYEFTLNKGQNFYFVIKTELKSVQG